MVKGVFISKALAVLTGVVTASAVGGIITMMIVYEIQISNNPPVRPTKPEPTETISTRPPPDLRLPGNLIPDWYQVYLHAHLYTRLLTNVTNQTFSFSGNSTVRFRCLERTYSIYLHSNQLNLSEYRVTDLDTGKQVAVKKTNLHNDESNFLEVTVEEHLKVNGNYSLFVAFEGVLVEDLTGFYVSQYTEDGDMKRFLAASQMQPTDARKVFPCFDEPEMKAVFDIVIIHKENTKALSNGRAKSTSFHEIDGERWAVTEFYQTKKMSTYLLAFVVSEFEPHRTLRPVGSIPIQTWARPEAISAGHANFSAHVTGRLLDYYEDLFGINYPLTKLDQVAVPDFSSGAMENWGLILYRESALLYEEGVSSTSTQEWIATVIAHELVHQWFGNLVTMKWWNEVWLNEGFATFFSYWGVDKVEPEWGLKDMFLLNELQGVFEVDSLATSHPLITAKENVQQPTEIAEQFDSITYSKGAAILRMLSAFMTEPLFMKGIQKYLKDNMYGNVETKTLWEYLGEEATNLNINVPELMEPWTNQMGYPVVTIDATNGDVFQQHFLLNDTSVDDLLWVIPISVMIKGRGEPFTEVLDKRSDSRAKFLVKEDEWILANYDSTGYFRVNYDQENWIRLFTQLTENLNVIPSINRAQLIDDAFNLARAKHASVTLALNSTKYLINEMTYMPWASTLKNLDYFILMFDRSEVFGPMQAYLRKQIGPLYEYFENETLHSCVPENHADRYAQISAVSEACKNGVPACRTMASNFFNAWRENNGTNRIHPNLKSAIYCSAIETGGEEEWDFAWKMYQRATIASEKDILRYALSCTKKIWLLNRYLEYTLDPTKIRRMDATSTIISIARNVAGQALAWDFVQAHGSKIIKEMSLGSIIDGVTQRFSTDFELKQLRQFQREHSEDSSYVSRTLEQAIERTEANIKWVKENKQIVLEWFKEESLDKNQETFDFYSG